MRILAEPIDAIVKFKGGEKPRPYKFRYLSDDTYHEVKVDKIIMVEEARIAGIRSFKYLCQSEIEGTVKLYELKYLIEDCRWELYKM